MRRRQKDIFLGSSFHLPTQVETRERSVAEVGAAVVRVVGVDDGVFYC